MKNLPALPLLAAFVDGFVSAHHLTFALVRSVRDVLHDFVCRKGLFSRAS
jgi:hypothetical protein